MGKHPLDKRLCCAAEQVRPGSVLADIGTDHALLPIELVSSGRCPGRLPRIFAPVPLPGRGRRWRIMAYPTGSMSGWEAGCPLYGRRRRTTIVIAGMGGETIVSILSESAWVASPRYRLILQPMSRPEFLRRWLRDMGFVLEEEPAVRDAGRLYTVLRVHFSPGRNSRRLHLSGRRRVYTGGLPRGRADDGYRPGLPASSAGPAAPACSGIAGIAARQCGGGSVHAEAVAGRILV